MFQKSSIMDERKKSLRENATSDVDNEHKKTRKSIEAEVKETLKEIAREELESEKKEAQKIQIKQAKKFLY
jgi:hypothetical protein